MNKTHPHKPVLAIGLMSGTSMDGIDAALIRSDGEHRIEALDYQGISYDQAFHHCLKSIEYATRYYQGNLELAANNYPARLMDYLQQALGLNAQQAMAYRQELRAYLFESQQLSLNFHNVIYHLSFLHGRLAQQLMRDEVQVIGFHGQSLFHLPAKKITVAVGDAAILAQQTKTTVINNFRESDVKHGGQGAPLAPLYHLALAVQDQRLPCAVVNCGGISNISLMPSSRPEDIIAYDCGPGNGLLDRFVKEKTQGRETMDRDARYARQGQVDERALDDLWQQACQQQGQNYFLLPAPKSLDIGDFILPTSVLALSLVDGCATLAAFTAYCIVKSLQLHDNLLVPTQWILAGGGWQNPAICHYLTTYLQQYYPTLPIQLFHANDINWHGQALEAQIFAYLAIRRLRELPLSYPNTTGVSQAITGGDIISYSEMCYDETN